MNFSPQLKEYFYVIKCILNCELDITINDDNMVTIKLRGRDGILLRDEPLETLENTVRCQLQAMHQVNHYRLSQIADIRKILTRNKENKKS